MFTLSVVLGMAHLQTLLGQHVIYGLPKPTLYLKPHYGVFLKGETIGLTCRCQCPLTRILFQRSHQQFTAVDPPEGVCETSVVLTAAHGYEGSYTCECRQWENGQWRSSKRSDPVQIVIRDEMLEPTIYLDPDSGEVSCKGDIRFRGGTFDLYKDRKGNPVESRTVAGDKRIATFNINTRNGGSVGNYSCRYQTEVAGRSMQSPLSKDVAITERDADNRLLLNVGLGCAAGIIVLLFVALIWFLITKRRQITRQNNERSTASAGGVTSHKDADNTCNTANLSSHPNTNGVYTEVPERDHEEITYATLNMEALTQKEAASVSAAETSLYAEVKKK